MKGIVLNFDINSNQGIISGNDGKRYTFSGDDWKDTTNFPKKDLTVDFEVNGQVAQEIYLSTEKPTEKPKNKSFLDGFGTFLMILGFILIIGGVNQKTTVSSGYDEVYNTGLMNDQRNSIEVGGIAFISGTILVSAKKNRQNY